MAVRAIGIWHLVQNAISLNAFLFFVALASTGLGSQDFKFIEPFDGQSLEQWEFDERHWRVEEGAIVGEIPRGSQLDHNTWCVWRGGELRDFDLRLKFRITGEAGANSGIQFRCQVDHVDHVSGYQADLDMGGVWLGRIYDEHGRALIVERGRRVHLQDSGVKQEQVLAPANQYAVLFRENQWNDYRIVAIGHRIAIYINGTLFADLLDEQQDEFDPVGQLALQLHSGPGTKVEFKELQLETLESDDDRLGAFSIRTAEIDQTPIGLPVIGQDGEPIDLGFESGDLSAWKVTGDAFQGQPVNVDGISQRWSDQRSNKQGDYFIGGYELVGDDGMGTLRSPAFPASQPYASFLFAGGKSNETRVEVLLVDDNDRVLMTVIGAEREQMERFVVDLREVQGQVIAVRVVDESQGAWGHVNFDDLRLHEAQPTFAGGITPVDENGVALNLGFESGDLSGWTATGDAFERQPVNVDGISERWPDQTSGKDGEFFIGGFEIVEDAGIGTLVSDPFTVTHPFASFLIAGGRTPQTRVEVLKVADDGSMNEVLYSASGEEREAMRRIVVDLTDSLGDRIAVRLVDENDGFWGHVNFDDFRFHDSPPLTQSAPNQWRSIDNPLLQHLIPNSLEASAEEDQTSVDEQRANESLSAAEQTLAQMFVPPGFQVQLIASEPDLHQPMAFTFDAQGRLWVVEGNSYPTRRPEGEGIDRILVFSDQDADGRFEQRDVFIEGLNLVSGMQVGHGGVWVGAAPELLFIPDADHDLVPDGEPIVMLDGFGYADTHETINSMIFGPDGWLYGNQGVFNQSYVGAPGTAKEDRVYLAAGVWRFHPVHHRFEVFAHGGSNQWGLDFDEFGQAFITHCRSYWGGGLTTQVSPRGLYWNQVNSGYAPFVCNHPVAGMEHLRNFLRASARYGHGEGGAGKPGSRQVYGGHSHVGTMIYLGDNWPSEYRNHLFTHNLHGHQINQQINLREGSGYNTVHAGNDVLFCADPQYIGVSIQCGPDGAVYLSDWYDPRHCHSPNAEQWDRSNGRIYRMQYQATYQPVAIDYWNATDQELVKAQRHPNDWHVRTARLVLAERAAAGTLSAGAYRELRGMRVQAEAPEERVRALWALYACGEHDLEALVNPLDSHEMVRSWQLRLAAEALSLGASGSDEFERWLQAQSQTETSLIVRKHLLLATYSLPSDAAWPILRVLASQPENGADRELPSLLWFAIAERMQQSEEDLLRGISLGEGAAVTQLRDYTTWFAPQQSTEACERLLQVIVSSSPEEQRRRLLLIADGLSGRRGLEMPESWQVLGPVFYAADDAATRRAAMVLGAIFGDQALFDEMRDSLRVDSSVAAKAEALNILAYDSSAAEIEVYLPLLDQPQLIAQVLPLLRRSSDSAVGNALLERLPTWESRLQEQGLEILCSRAAWSHHLLDAIEEERFPKQLLSAYDARQMSSLGDAALNQRLEEIWGRLGSTSEERLEQIANLAAAYNEAPLWAYDQGAGQSHFQKLCANCHVATEDQPRIGPSLEGTGSKGVHYILENLIDPNAVVGKDFQATIIQTIEGRSITGVIVDENETAITIRTSTETEVVPSDEIEVRAISPNSFMPEGILDPLNDRERIELLKYLMGL